MRLYYFYVSSTVIVGEKWGLLRTHVWLILALTPSLVRAVDEHTEFNKTTETQSSQRMATPFLWEKEIRVQSESGKSLSFYDCSLLRICRLQFVEFTYFTIRISKSFIQIVSFYILIFQFLIPTPASQESPRNQICRHSWYRFYEPDDHQSSIVNHCDVSVSRHHSE